MKLRNSVQPAKVAVLLGLTCVLSFAAPEPKKLAVVRAVFAQMEDGEVVGATDPFVPGETIYFRCNIDGFKRGEKDVIHLTYQVEAKDSRGLLLQAQQSGKVETTLAPEDKEWLPKIRETIIVPPLADSGEYQVVVTIKDELAGTTAEGHATFSVKGRDVPQSETLVVRNFRFLRAEEDGAALAVAAYRPGDALWARFEMTGYKLGDGNQFDLDYGLTVLRADGSTAYTEPHAAELKNKTFYPQRYQPGALSLNFPKDQVAGAYTIVLTVRDNVGKQTYETKEKFSVE